MELSKRLLRIIDALAGEQLASFNESLDQGLRDWEKRLGIDTQQKPDQRANKKRDPESTFRQPGPIYSDQMLKDLAVFGLTPPVTKEALKKAWKRELKKYHPDKFALEPEKIDSAKRIVQILGETYERLNQQVE